MASKSLTELIAQADQRGLAASGLACLDRCLPLLASEADALRPLWAGLVDGEEDWSGRLAAAREAMEGADAADEAAVLVRQMLGAAPSEWEVAPLRQWADECSVAALELHHRFDGGTGADAAELLKRCRESEPDCAGPLVTGELRRQIQILEILAEADVQSGGLRAALDVSTEGQRVLRAALSRRARVKK
ncbi:hypothetical protein OG883_03070 [Streptomyces sp. NBC_01142]|uniref:hypothetical protein n=1 Tax=Streptomyces sp. NBC_01142 TaxID=2975865 RepID=UPI0022513D29|nr:hypothetical protein [Streptomyces sp. NBC_01142]MCX4818900.1 hypothetical protein [Streptomyces sp. NBC_01142]